jgi:hypothetical protein
MAKVRKRKGWLLIDYYDEAGKRHRKTLHLKANRENKKKAEVEKKKVEYELEAGIHVEKKKREQTRNITLSKGLDEFLDIKSDKKESTKECYELAVKNFLK